MSNPISSFLIIKADIGQRLRAARTAVGLKQADLATLGDVSRATQISYETGSTEPTTAYLRAIQESGIDIPAVLFDLPSSKLDAKTHPIDWQRLQQANEDVEFFCQRFAPQCPASYRWQMVKELYLAPITLGGAGGGGGGGGTSPQPSPMTVLSSVWARYSQT